MDCILQLVNNPIEVFEETSRLLLKIADNVLKAPSNQKVRTLQKSNETIKNKVLNVNGGIACLKAMGFQESEQTFTLPTHDSLKNLRQINEEINKLRNGNQQKAPENRKNIPCSSNKGSEVLRAVNSAPKNEKTAQTTQVQENNSILERFQRITLPVYKFMFTNPFLQEIEMHFNKCLFYENSYLQSRALSVIPIKKLEVQAQLALRALQERIKKERLEESEVNLQDFMILELLSWFHDDFFEWVNNPPCTHCQSQTKFLQMATDKNLFPALHYTERVEVHKCLSCNSLTAFPRYNDLNILLETRKGRCGEWANVFTLMCRSLGWDARFVMDQTDHVWTEVYSFSQRKWLHCDPCENICDKPLMYEAGWKKVVSYVIAYSGEEVQDVTWRYSSKHKEVLTRRRLCKEEDLVQAMHVLREMRQSCVSESRQLYLKKRFLAELVELMIEKQPTEDVHQGRTSGDMDWRLARSEIQKSNSTNFIWEFTPSDVLKDYVIVQYSSALNKYEKIGSDAITTTIMNWESGVFTSEGIFHKVEKDWKQTYLCRRETSKTGYITWKFQTCDNYAFDSIDCVIPRRTFENGVMSVKLCNSDKCVLLTTDKEMTKDFSGCNKLMCTASFSGGKGDNAWQHSQLCRENLGANEFSLKFIFKFKKVS